jgi:gamma-glutamyltranspeptidase/glutathione hydrolase
MLLNKEYLFMYMSNITLLEPASSGIGGDAFCLYYDSKKGTVKGLEGAGR